MAYIRKRKGRFTVAVRRKHGQKLYRTFDKLSDARSFAKETELKIQQNSTAMKPLIQQIGHII